MTKQKAIRVFCLSCCGGSSKDVIFCTDPKCTLWPYRLGGGLKSTAAKRTLRCATERFPQDVSDLSGKYGLDPAIYFGPEAAQLGLRSAKRANGRRARERGEETRSPEIDD